MSTDRDHPVDAVIFDLGGVLIDWNPRYLYRRLFGDDTEAMEAFLGKVCNPEWNARQDAGRPWAEAVAELSARHPEARDLIAAYDERWEEMLGGPIQGTVEILGELRAAAVPLYALSNWSAAKYAIARARYPFLGWFRDVVISGEVGVIKPDPSIFRLLLERHRLDPASTVYVDDSDPNVSVAEQLGMIAIRFRGPEPLRADLARLGLLATETAPTDSAPAGGRPIESTGPVRPPVRP